MRANEHDIDHTECIDLHHGCGEVVKIGVISQKESPQCGWRRLWAQNDS